MFVVSWRFLIVSPPLPINLPTMDDGISNDSVTICGEMTWVDGCEQNVYFEIEGQVLILYSFMVDRR